MTENTARTAALRELVESAKAGDLDHRNSAIGRLRHMGVEAKDIADLIGIATATVYRIAKNWVPDMSEEFAADAEADEIAEADAEEHAAAVAAKDAALAEQAEQGITAAYLGADITAYIQQLRASKLDADNIVGEALFQVQGTQGEDRRKAIVAAANLGIERKHIAAAAGVKSVGRIIRAARGEQTDGK
ncbi:hypothetical protein QDA03_gp46 [Microbacterium phage Terij]|uniref:Uncharacterized protein n=1 Tax=Microbacterium phage Terij TaxID=2686229 RepID=A0A6B9LEU6_9CAUD|nr:hypothetical protein QDA03_gp46 [Microbacterium phage Terij]QHB37195.1 hypothetical protein SEA_TERIJ_61 [Microbacterium phage Terij]